MAMHDRVPPESQPAQQSGRPRSEQTGKSGSANFAAGPYFDFVADAITDYAICIVDGQGYIRSWHSGAEKLLGYSTTEILGQHVSNFCPESHKLDDLRQEN